MRWNRIDFIDMLTRSGAKPEVVDARGAVCAGVFMLLLDVTIVNVALPNMGALVRRVAVGYLQWVISAYALTLAAFPAAAGSLADLRQAAAVQQDRIVIFTAASAGLCALATRLSLLLDLARCPESAAR